MKKKFLFLLSTLLVLSVVLAACGGDTAEPAAEEETTAEEAAPAEEEAEAEEEMAPITISLWHSLKDTETAGLAEIITAYQGMHSNVEFELLFTPFDDLRNKYETAAATGAGPDLLIGGDDWGPAMFDAVLVADVSDVVVDGVNAAALSVGQYKGAQVMLPYVLKGVVMYRNTAILPEASASWEDLKAAAEAATSGDIFGALLEIGVFFSYGHLYGLDGALMDADGQPAFNTPEGQDWLAMLADFVALGADDWYNDNDVNLFKEGKVGVIVDGTWNLGDLSDSLGENLTIDPWPAGMSGFVQTGAMFLNANADADHAAVAKDFMGFLLSQEAQALFYASDGAFIPSNTGVAVDDPLRLQALAAFDDGIGWIVRPEMGSYWGPMETAVLGYLREGTAAADSLATAEESVLGGLGY